MNAAIHQVERPTGTLYLDLVLEVVRIRGRLRLAWLALLQEEDALQLLLSGSDDPEREQRWRRETPELAPWLQQLESTEAQLAALSNSEPLHLVRVLGLDAAGADVFHLVLAATAEPSIRALCGRLAGVAQPAWPTLAVAARLFGHGRTLHLSPHHPLRAWEIVRVTDPEPPTGSPLTMEATIARWAIGGGLEPSEALAGRLTGTPAGATFSPGSPVSRVAEQVAKGALPPWISPAGDAADPRVNTNRVAEQLRRVRTTSGGSSAPVVVVRVAGPPGVGRRAFARQVMADIGLGTFCVDLTGLAGEALERTVLHAHRHAWLADAAPIWLGDLPMLRYPAPFPVQVVLAGPGEKPHIPHEWARIDADLPLPTLEERAALWSRFVPSSSGWPNETLRDLARRHRVTPGDVARAAWFGPTNAEEAATSVRLAMRGELGDLAQPLPCTYTWDDLVLPEPITHQLHALVHEAQSRAEMWEEPEIARIFPQGRGLLALFTGPPGTGKTMSAQILAHSLGLDLYRIDLSSLVSKYVGETSKNIERLLSASERLDVVLLFDEADALFGKRTEIRDAHDRFANTDTNYLLQAIESWPGVGVLATNKRGNLDEAFLRRLRHIVDFPTPDAELRARLWTKLIRQILPHTDPDAHRELLLRFASSVPLSGAQIKNALLTAWFAVRRERTTLSATHLLEGVDRELIKIGRGLSRADHKRLERHAPR